MYYLFNQVIAETFGAAADSSTVLCFRSQVHLPALVLPGVHNPAAATTTAGGGSDGGSVMKVAVSLRSRGKQQQHEERATSTGFAMLGSASGAAHGGVGVGDGEREAWVIGTVSVPLPSLLPTTPAW